MDSRDVREVGDLVDIACNEEAVVLPVDDPEAAQTERRRIDDLIDQANRTVCLDAIYEPLVPPSTFAQGSHRDVGVRAIWIRFKADK